MIRDGWKRIGALVVVLLVIAGAWIVLQSPTARAQTSLFGYIDECGAIPVKPLGGVGVSLIDAQGANPILTVAAVDGGVYTFTPPTGTYELAFSLTGYFNKQISTPIRFDGSTNLRVPDVCLERMPARTIDFVVQVNATGGSGLAGATVRLFNATRNQVVATNTTGSSGSAILRIWPDALRLQVSRASFQPNETAVNTATDSPKTISLLPAVFILGRTIASGGFPLTVGVVAYLYNIANVSSSLKVINATVQAGGVFNFTAIPGTYRMIVDANGYTASNTLFVVPSTSPGTFFDRVLTPSPSEVASSSFVVNRTDWNNLAVFRNLTLNADSSILGLGIPFIRSVVLQVDLTFGNGNGTVEPGEWAKFVAWLAQRGTFYVTTDRVYPTPENVFDVEGAYYNSTTQDPATAQPAGGPAPTGRLWINTSAGYVIRGTPVPNGRTNYTVNLNMTADTNVTVYKDQVYVVDLPLGYEMVSKTTTGTVATTGWTEVTVDPGTGGTPRIRMTVAKSEGGVARAMVTGPPGRFYVLNDTLDNYTAIISSETNTTFSARQSTDPVGDILEANFTWRFDNSSNPNNASWIGYGIDTTFNYTTGGLFAVNLTVVETGGNKTYRDFTLYADDVDPVAQVRTNRTSGNANGTTLRLPQDIEVRFDGGFSTDVIFNGSAIPGVIFDGVSTSQSGYAWDFEGNGIADSFLKQPRFTWTKPGNYTLNLTITDSVGHKGVNATLQVIVNDTVAPVPRYVILDPSNAWVSPPVSMIEGKAYSFNASTTTDNYDNVTALNLTWTVPGPARISPYGNVSLIQTVAKGANGTAYGLNVSVEWIEFNSSYQIKLNVTDTGFDWMNPAKRNSAVITINNVVQFDPSKRPNLQITTGSMKVNPASPEEGQGTNVTVQVFNQANRGNATHVNGTLSQTEPTPVVVLSSTPLWYDDKWVPLPSPVVIGTGKTVYAVFTVQFAVQGPRTLVVHVNDTLEPWTQDDGANKATQSITVRQAGWVLPLVIGASIGGIVAIGVGLRYRSRIRSGALSLARRRPGKEVAEEEAEDEEDAEVEDRPKEKKRL